MIATFIVSLYVHSYMQQKADTSTIDDEKQIAVDNVSDYVLS